MEELIEVKFIFKNGHEVILEMKPDEASLALMSGGDGLKANINDRFLIDYAHIVIVQKLG